MFCDLVESSALAEELGAEDYREAVRIIHESSAQIVERHDGQISQYLGDGILVLFGYPQAHEDDAARAVQAALDVQAAIPACAPQIRARVPRFSRELHSRAAIHSGFVVIGELGAGAQRAVLALGDVVNIAFRLQELAPADTAIITGATRRLIGDRFRLAPRGSSVVRGIRAPLETFAVVGPGTAPARHDATRRGERTPFVGRTDEVAHLMDRWEQVIAGRGQTVVVSGEPGMGKSRLLSVLRRSLPPAAHWLELHGSEYHKSSELHAVMELFERRVLQGATGADARDRLAQQLAAVGDGGSEAVHLLASLLSLPASRKERSVALLPAEHRRTVLDALTRWVHRLADESPTVIACEDLQWIDPTSQDLLHALVTSIADRRLFLVLTCRTSFQLPWAQQPNELRLAMKKLPDAEAQQLVEAIAQDHPLPDHIVRQVLTRGGGVPLYLEEFTRMVVDAPGDMGAVPAGLQELMNTRLAHLSASAKETIELGAVIGRDFSRDLLLAASGKAESLCDADVHVLLESGLLEATPDGYSFRHLLLRDAVFQRVMRRAEIHERVATTLLERFPRIAETQPELVAHHFTKAGAVEQAWRAWRRAGTRSRGNGAYVEAKAHFEEALKVHATRSATAAEQTAHIHDELELRKDLGISLIVTKGYSSEGVSENYERALQLSARLSEREEEIPIHVLYGLWGTYLVRGDREATDAFARHFQRVEQSADPLARHVAHSTLGARHFYRGEFTAAREQCEKAMALYEPSQHFVLIRDYGFEGGIYSHLYVACILCFTGCPDQGLAVVDRALNLCDSIGDPYAKAVALGLAACVARERREPEEARRHSDALIALSTDHQLPFWLGIGHCLHGWSRVAAGDASGGAEEIQLGLAIWRATGASVPGTYLRLTLVDAAIATGDITGGLTVVEEGLLQCRTTLEAYQEPEYHRLKGELLKRAGDAAAACGEMRCALEAARTQGAQWMELRAAASLARLTPAEGSGPLADVVARLAEGADLADLKEAKALLGACL
jgi:class 3 adenylate cyclase/tetratricopeptide (TPR) repeat protein